ncbi:hypothetical protein DB30_01821 [Enhygromyxa salina]|uniref:Uncharacterized protein n=1 Tax=Enhygromyxa salina TaxID=215803 RepID=A0A0C2CR71_9BACT|nr:hypothetical protein DB30_01821 [Enhygromyxa salina]
MMFSAPAQGAVSCLPGETLELTNPIVAVVDGPDDDVAQEQERWSNLDPEIEGLGLYFADESLELEKEK